MSFMWIISFNLCDSLCDLYEGSDLVLADGAFLIEDWNETLPHLSVEHIVDFTNKYGNKSIISHINPRYDNEQLQEKVKKSNCIIAQEGESYEL